MHTDSVRKTQSIYFVLMIFCFFSLTLSAQPIQITEKNVSLYLNPNKNETASLLNSSNKSYSYLEEQSGWLKIRLIGWIWKKSTNYKTAKQQVIVTANNENFRSAPNKTAIAQLKYNTPLNVLQSNKNWLQASLIVWLDASLTTYQVTSINTEQAVRPILSADSESQDDGPLTTIEASPNEQQSNILSDGQSQPLLVKRIKLPATTQEPELEANKPPPPPPSLVKQWLSLINLEQNTLLLAILALLSLLLIFTFIIIWILARRLTKQQINQGQQISNMMAEIQTRLNNQLMSHLGPMHDSTVRGLEQNKGDIALLIERRMADFNEKLLSNLSTMRVKMGESLNHSSRSQAQAFSNFQNHLGETVNLSLKRNLDSLNKMFHDLRQSTDQHMKEINQRVEERLKKGFEQTNQIFIDIKDRLNQIDQAQKRISELSNNVVSLQKTLDNKGARGAFGEVQLIEIVKDMIPSKFYKFQHNLSNDKRPDCIIFLPPPTGKLIIDAKFPLENYKQMFDKELSNEQQNNAGLLFKRDIKKHIKDIADKYIIPGETANGAVMFIPSEAVFAEIHAHHPDLVKQAQTKHVWMTSPTTLMALLTTARAVLADDERSKQAKIIHEHLNVLAVEFNRFSKRMDDLAKHINMAHEDVNKINISAKKITDKFEQIENTDLEELPKTPPLAINKKISA